MSVDSSYILWKDIVEVVSEGSILRPLLFNIFVNDISMFLLNW